MTRSQIIDILERNVSLYREEDSFVHYLVELAIYLMEYEYDWSESSATPPDLNPRPEREIRQIANKPPVEIGKRTYSSLSPNSGLPTKNLCPFCGSEVGNLLICPSCRNLTR
jgi:hypothetical protein